MRKDSNRSFTKKGKKMLKLALPNGSLESRTIALFAAAGWSVKREGRKALCATDCPFAETVFFTRPQAIPRVVASGICDAGICGLDYVTEEQYANPEARLTQLATLAYSKETNGPAMVALFTSENNVRPARNIPPGSTVYSEYPNITKRFFEEVMEIPDVRIIRSPGSTEGHVAIGEYQYGVCVVEQGKTLAANNLRVIAELLVSSAVLVARPDRTDGARTFTQLLLNAARKESA